jgi:DNA-binding GntR family transcriptional regulator
MEEAHEARLALEIHAAELTVGRLSDDELAELYRLMCEQSTLWTEQRLSTHRGKCSPTEFPRVSG